MKKRFFFEESKNKPKGLTVVPVEGVPLCETLEDAYNFNARKTTSQVLRKHLDNQGLTAFELLHSYDQVKNLTRNEDFLNKAIHTISINKLTRRMASSVCMNDLYIS